MPLRVRRADRGPSLRPRLSAGPAIGPGRPRLGARGIAWGPLLVATPVFVGLGILAGIDPELALLAAFGLGFILLALTDLTAALIVLIIAAFVETGPIAGTAVSASKTVGALLALGWLARLATRTDEREGLIFSDHPVFSYVLGVFLAWVLVTMAWARNEALAVEQASSYLMVAVLYVIVYTAVRTRRQAALVIAGFLAGTTLVAAYGLIARPSIDTVEAGRLVSTVKDPNFLAANLIAGIALAGGALAASRGAPALRVASLSALVLCLSAFALTGSRGGIVGLAVALVAAVLFSGRWRARTTLAISLIAALAVGYYALYAPPETTERIESATQGEVAQRDTRYTIWTVGWRMVEDRPLHGVGVGNFEHESVNYVLEPGTTFRTDRVVDSPGVTHNSFLGPLAELGLVGLVLFASIIGFSIACAVRAARRFAADGDFRMEALTRGVIVAAIGFLAAAFFISAETSKTTWLLLGLGPALLAVARAGARERPAA